MTNYLNRDYDSVPDYTDLRDTAQPAYVERQIDNVRRLTTHPDCEPVVRSLLGDQPPNAMLGSDIAARRAIQDDVLMTLSDLFESLEDIDWVYLEMKDRRWAIEADHPAIDLKNEKRMFGSFKKALPNLIAMTRVSYRKGDGVDGLYHFIGGLAWGPKLCQSAHVQIEKTRRLYRGINGEEPIKLTRIDTLQTLAAAVYQTFDMTAGYSPAWQKAMQRTDIKKSDLDHRLLELSMLHILASCALKYFVIDAGEGNSIMKGILAANDARMRRNKAASPIHGDCIPHALLHLGRQVWEEQYQLPRVLRR